jgi:guanyl-specific ribonuclease Sa
MYVEMRDLWYEVVGPPICVGRFSLIGGTVISQLVTDPNQVPQQYTCRIDQILQSLVDHKIKKIEDYSNLGSIVGSLLPSRPHGYYKRIWVTNKKAPICARLVIGRKGEVYFTGNHYLSFVQVHV